MTELSTVIAWRMRGCSGIEGGCVCFKNLSFRYFLVSLVRTAVVAAFTALSHIVISPDFLFLT